MLGAESDPLGWEKRSSGLSVLSFLSILPRSLRGELAPALRVSPSAPQQRSSQGHKEAEEGTLGDPYKKQLSN
ncbi:hypothetical protein SRHO_G00300090 [Serrasalmus rhombeus]